MRRKLRLVLPPNNPHPSDQGNARGRNIEDQLFTFLADAYDGHKIATFLQPDALVLGVNGKCFLVEAKGQDHYEAPPFDGHGLPVVQATRYEQVRLACGLRTILMVWEPPHLFTQWIDLLERGRKFDTSGTVKHPRRIYPLANFERSDLEAR